MIGKLRFIVLILLALKAAGVTANAQTDILYAATGTFGVPGALYILNPADGSTIAEVGALNDSSGNNYGLTGLRYDPANGVLYGATVTDSPTDPNYLVTINPLTAQVTPIGPLGAALTDLALDPTTGIFYGVSGTSQKFYTIDPNTGAATQIGQTGINFQNGGGLAANSSGTLYGVNNYEFYRYNKTSGAATDIGPTTLAGYVRALAFDSNNTLYGIEGGGTSGDNNLRELIKITVNTGVGHEVGATINDLDALAFLPVIPIPEASSMELLVFGVCLLGFVAKRRLRFR